MAWRAHLATAQAASDDGPWRTACPRGPPKPRTSCPPERSPPLAVQTLQTLGTRRHPLQEPAAYLRTRRCQLVASRSQTTSEMATEP